jgi:hypothetical protein
MATISKYETRADRAERKLLYVSRYCRIYTMPDGSWRTLSFTQSLQGYNDVVNNVNSREAKIIRNAVTDNNEGKMLKLLFAVQHPIDTDI